MLTEGRLILEFTFDDLMRIRNWQFTVLHHEEFISRSVLTADPSFMDEQAKNITCNGMTGNTLTLLNVSYHIIRTQVIRNCKASTDCSTGQRRVAGSTGIYQTPHYNHRLSKTWTGNVS